MHEISHFSPYAFQVLSTYCDITAKQHKKRNSNYQLPFYSNYLFYCESFPKMASAETKIFTGNVKGNY